MYSTFNLLNMYINASYLLIDPPGGGVNWAGNWAEAGTPPKGARIFFTGARLGQGGEKGAELIITKPTHLRLFTLGSSALYCFEFQTAQMFLLNFFKPISVCDGLEKFVKDTLVGTATSILKHLRGKIAPSWYLLTFY